MTVLWLHRAGSLAFSPNIRQNSFLKEFPTKLVFRTKSRIKSILDREDLCFASPVDEKIDSRIDDGGEVGNTSQLVE